MLKRLYLLLISILFIFGCEDKNDGSGLAYVIVDPCLPQDDNGYYHLTIDRNNWQTLHRFQGWVMEEDGDAIQYVPVGWKSDLYWVMGDTLGYIVKRGLNDEMVYVPYETVDIIGFEGMIVPTINPASYSDGTGMINQMSGFVRSMIGDTATITLNFFNDSTFFKVVLD